MIDGVTERSPGDKSGSESFFDRFDLRVKALILMDRAQFFIDLMGVIVGLDNVVVVVRDVF